MKKIWVFILIIHLWPTPETFAKPKQQNIPNEINLIFDNQTITLNFQNQKNLLKQKTNYFLKIKDKEIPINLNKKLPTKNDLWNIKAKHETQISPKLLNEFLESALAVSQVRQSTVEVRTNRKGEIIFEGKPKEGFEVDEQKLITLLNTAIKTGKTNIRVPAKKIFSKVIIDPRLEKKGIKEIVAIGKSNFTGSAETRKTNIRAASKKFNGHIIPKSQRFSFNEILESVEEEDGFVKELVIRGNNLKKEYGGGVCQVSTTAFRAAYTGGFPITQRREHSYAVPYYQPVGLDSTIYLGVVDLRFKNDTQGDILIQTFTEGDNLYFVFYGTRDNRQVALEGPFLSNFKSAPTKEIVIESTDLPPGETEIISTPHEGFQAEWVRRIKKNGIWNTEHLNSEYRPWPSQILKGKEETS